MSIKRYIYSLLKIVLVLTVFFGYGQETKTFASLDEVLNELKKVNITFENSIYQTQLAELTRKTAIGNTINPRVPFSIQAINNIDQQVSFFPGPIFGMPEGTFREVTMGQQYSSIFNLQPQFDIINLASWSQVKSAKINEQLVENQNKMNEQQINQQANAIYFNILSFNGQKEVIQDNIKIAENLLRITNNRFKEGISRKQEVNEAEANLITLQDKLSQIESNLKIQQQSLVLLFEDKIIPELTQSVWDYENTSGILESKDSLQTENAELQYQMAKQDLKVTKFQQLPVLSFISSFNWQNVSNEYFFHSNSNWVHYSYIGLKLSWDFPTTVQKLSLWKDKQIKLDILKNNTEHIKKENKTKNAKMVLEYEKALSQLKNFQKIYDLKKDTYQKNYNQYMEDILSLDKLLISQNDMLISQMNVVLALANIGYNYEQIQISNNN